MNAISIELLRVNTITEELLPKLYYKNFIFLQFVNFC